VKLRDFEHRFEETLRQNKLSFTVETSVEPEPGLDSSWTWKKFSIQARQPEHDSPLLINLGKYHRSSRMNRRAKTTTSCFVVEPDWIYSGNRKKAGVKRGLANVWRIIRVHCMPL
jgi:hypothetical protein